MARMVPAPLQKSFFLNTGSETTEAAIKMAKCYTGKFKIVAFSASYHGLTQGSVSATYSAGRKNGASMMPGQLSFPAPYAYRSPVRHADDSWDWETGLSFGWSMIDRQSVDLLRPSSWSLSCPRGGILDFPQGYLTRMAAECKKRGILIVMDEAQTGVGRTDDMFAFEHEGVVPDILALSKTLTRLWLAPGLGEHHRRDRAWMQRGSFPLAHDSLERPPDGCRWLQGSGNRRA